MTCVCMRHVGCVSPLLGEMSLQSLMMMMAEATHVQVAFAVRTCTPFTEPSFLPFASSSSTPHHTPSENAVSPMKRTVPTPVMKSDTVGIEAIRLGW